MPASDGDLDRPGRLKRRAEFLHVGKGRRWHGKAMTLQAAPRREDDEAAGSPPRFGFTLTKRVGCAVVRNRARRRLREAVRLMADLPAKPGHDYVIVGRLEAIRMPFDGIGRELVRGLAGVHGREGSGGRPRADGGRNATDKAPGRPAPERIRPKP